MNRLVVTAILGLCLLLTSAQERGREQKVAEGVRFEAVDVFIDTGDRPLAAYQFRLSATGGDAKIVGIEGGGSKAFREPPYYDLAALQNDRVIIADFNLGGDVPSGRVRVATVHMRVTGEQKPSYEVDLQVAATRGGDRIPASITLEERKDE